MAADPDLNLILRAKRGDFAARNELLAKYKPNIDMLIRRWSRAPVPTAAIQGEAMKLLLLAADRYDPSSGVLFKTFMETQLRGLYRYVNAHKNVARVPEHRVLQIRRFQNAKSLLEAQKDREPTHDEMADHLGWGLQQVQMMDTALSRGAFALSESEERNFADPINFYGRMGETLEFLYFQMSPDEKLVYDYSLGAHGKPKISSVADISRRTGLSTDKVYAIKRKMAKDVTRVV
jgi:DNA-directed RNA polymerase specialized sigma subunit